MKPSSGDGASKKPVVPGPKPKGVGIKSLAWSPETGWFGQVQKPPKPKRKGTTGR